MKQVFAKTKGVNFIPDFILRTMTQIKVPAFVDGALSERFSSGKEAIRPIIFSHGLSACEAFYTALHHSMAAHGHLVIAVNHQDWSCFYTENKDGAPIKYEHRDLHCGVEYRNS